MPCSFGVIVQIRKYDTHMHTVTFETLQISLRPKVTIQWKPSMSPRTHIHTSVGAIGQMVDYSSVTVYKDGRSLPFPNNRIFILNLTFPTVPQYPHIFFKAATILRLLVNETNQFNT